MCVFNLLALSPTLYTLEVQIKFLDNIWRISLGHTLPCNLKKIFTLEKLCLVFTNSTKSVEHLMEKG